MAVSTPALVTPAVGASADNVTTASFTPSADAILFAWISARPGAATIPTVADSLAGTWVPLVTGTEAGNFAGRAFYQVIGPSPSAMTVTATSTGAGQVGLIVLEVTGASTDFTNVEEDTDTVGDPSVTMAAYESTSQVLALYGGNAGGQLVTPPTDFTEIYDAQPATNLRMEVSHDDGATATTSLAWVNNSTDSMGIGIEIKEPTGGITGAIYNDPDTFHTASVGRGAVGITGADFTNTSTFGSATIGAGGSAITGVRYNDPDTFHTAAVTRGAVNITGVRYNDPDVFRTALIQQPASSQGVSGVLFEDPDTFHTAAITTGVVEIQGTLFENVSLFGSHTVTEDGAGISAVLFENQTIFHSARVNDESRRLGPFQARAYLSLGQFRFAVLQTRPEFPQPLLASPYMWYDWQLDAFMSQYPDYATTLAMPEDWPINQE